MLNAKLIGAAAALGALWYLERRAGASTGGGSSSTVLMTRYIGVNGRCYDRCERSYTDPADGLCEQFKDDIYPDDCPPTLSGAAGGFASGVRGMFEDLKERLR